jgi:ATP-dependent helicase/nuclease subunit A
MSATAPNIIPVDEATRQEIRTRVGENLLVEAGAGTGKTTSLVGRITEILACGHATVDELAVVTFTHKAAAELSARVREQIEEAIPEEVDPARRERLVKAARGLYRARIETIHSFSISLLRERPVEAGLDPEFRTLTDLESDLLFEDAFGDWLAGLLSEDRPEVTTALNLGLGPDELRQAVLLIHQHRYLLPLTPFEVDTADGSEVGEWLEANLPEIEEVGDRCNNEENPQLGEMARVIDFARRLAVEGTTQPARARLISRGMPRLSLGRGSQGDWDDPDDCKRWKKELGAAYNELRDRVPLEMRSAALAALLPRIEQFVREYEQHRRDEGVADYDDLIIWSRDLVRDRPEVREYFRERFRCLLIDEFQDTDPIQVELALYLASESPEIKEWRQIQPAPGKLFVVGDPKQSIYRFRRADIGIYDEVKAGSLDGREIVQNFRSAPRVIEWVNAAFNKLFEARPGLQPANVPLEKSPFEEKLKRPPVIVVRGHDPEANAAALRADEATTVAALLHDAVDGPDPWLVRDQVTGEHRQPTWRDVAILLPRRTGLEAYEEALATIGVPYRHEGSRDYFQRDEVRDLIFLLRAIDDPRDRLSLIGALRSGAFGCSDDDLVIHTGSGGRWDYRFKESSEAERVVRAFEVLRGLHWARGKLSLPLLVQRVVAESRLVEVALTGRDGPQAAANLLAIVERARGFAAAGSGSLRAFTRWLAENTEREANEVDAGIAEETDDVVRIMTIHGAKGLEFPIVVMANVGGTGSNQAGPVPREAEGRLHFYVGSKRGGAHFPTPGYEHRWDEEREALDLEDIRLLYVAATRARDHLVIPDFRGKHAPGPLLSALDAILPEEGAHETEIDGVWVLDAAQVERPVPVEVERRKVRVAEAKAALAERKEWSAEREQLIQGAREGLELTVASSVERSVRPLAAEASHSEAAMLVSEGPPLEVGDALHKVMQKISLPAADDLELWVEAICVEFGIPEQTNEVTKLAHRCLDSPTVKRALELGTYQREVPFAAPRDGGFALGRVDLAFKEEDGLHVIDFKTDEVTAKRAKEHTLEHHAGQASVYSEALASCTGLPVASVVFVYCRPQSEVVAAENIEARSKPEAR